MVYRMAANALLILQWRNGVFTTEMLKFGVFCMTMPPTTATPDPHPLRVLRIASIIEGATLLLLLLVAVPLKRMADLPIAVSIVGPIHGAAFLIYSALVLQSLFSRLISITEAARLMVVAFIPFGAWMVAGMLRRPRVKPQ